MILSIALCTYNGVAHLPQQWESLLAQERQPDELIVCDDGSTDDTRSLLYRLAAEAPFRVKIIENTTRLGFDQNFGQALRHCTGDLIFICDQDDYWLPQKLQVMSHYMQTHPTVEIAFNNAWIADEHLRPTNTLFWDWLHFDERARQRWRTGKAMQVLLEGPRVMGCATVLRRRVVPQLIPIPGTLPRYNYDGWISLMGAALGVIQFVDQPLQLYRTHHQQQIGIRESPPPPYVYLRDRFTRDRARKLEPFSRKRVELETIQHLLTQRLSAPTTAMEQVGQKLAHYTMRSGLPASRLRRIKPVWREWQRGSYHRYADASSNWYSPYLAILGDLLE